MIHLWMEWGTLYIPVAYFQTNPYHLCFIYSQKTSPTKPMFFWELVNLQRPFSCPAWLAVMQSARAVTPTKGWKCNAHTSR